MLLCHAAAAAASTTTARKVLMMVVQGKEGMGAVVEMRGGGRGEGRGGDWRGRGGEGC